MKHEPRPAIHIKMQHGWAHKLGGIESLGICKAGQLAWWMVPDMAPACQLWGGGFRKGMMASAYLEARHIRISVYTSGAFQAAIQVLEVRRNEF